ncbi:MULTISPECIES: phosphotransferase enzyme family protein [Pseudoalteromonas]|uniref:Aminoglycoside phosphotransferase n=1 Tax=Pseudoalteromonas amylolytica TaxID=1859457 RepID=A0A1S1MXY3_9GAMM|nr:MULTISPECIES: aminoglycoside phosphotransferase family protein [Pseudoalteromonas]MCF6435984.1 aminoglycoside phosphotransferase family protein [Pseudoalteromonas sp. MMG022]OHU89340.1 aminoglycoside phosphotransferase [Pseudoalteromonas sp. JW3]OHU92240.1 aminoglycoside phosphotransferase [Pseudoalteromonas amylolytica]
MENRAVAAHLSQQFGLQGEQPVMNPIGNGHINTTMLLKDTKQAVVVQKLNTDVFPNPEQLVENARAIEQHLSDKVVQGEYGLHIIKHLPTVENEYLVNHNGGVWRALEFIGGSYSEDVVDSTSKAQTAANAFGQFAKALEDFEAQQLHHVIPDFHNLAKRIETFKKTLQQDRHNRAQLCIDDIAFCQSQFSLADELQVLLKSIPLRPCHNDTKINNMLFCTKTNQGKAVIDMDTCMPGYWLFDFGDMVRTFCSPEAEDSLNLENVVVREEIFSAIVKGYVEPLADTLTEQEKNSFLLGAKVMPFMIGLRFLTDYLDGDNYFAVHREQHNLQRSRNQFKLYQDVLAKEKILKDILAQY